MNEENQEDNLLISHQSNNDRNAAIHAILWNLREKKQKIDGEHYFVTQELSDGSLRELSQNGDKIFKTKTIQKDGSYIILDEDMLTQVGKYQARLMAKIGQAWYNKKSDMTNISSFLQKITEKSTLHPFVTKALAFGKKLKAEKKNMLINHHLLKSAWNKFKNPKIEAPKTGVYKLFSEEYRR